MPCRDGRQAGDTSLPFSELKKRSYINPRAQALGPNADGLKYVDFMKNQKLDNSPRGPMAIDPVERDIVQNMYIRRVEKRDGKYVNVDIDTIPMVKDPWKIDNPPKAN